MNAVTQFSFLAATNKSWILLHDIMGAVALVVLLLLGYLFHRHRLKQMTNLPNEARIEQKIGRIQLWAIYLLVIGVTIFFFFIFPRMTSQEAQVAPKAVPSEHAD